MSYINQIVIAVSIVIFNISLASAALPFDINGDGQEGLPEAVHALQVSAGLAPAVTLNGYDLTEYMYVDGGEYLYEYQVKSSIPPRYGSMLSNISRSSGVGETEQIIKTFQNGEHKEYLLINSERVFYQGEDRFIGQVRETQYQFQPDVVMGSRNMHQGDVFSDVYLKDYTCATEGYPCTSNVGMQFYQVVEYTFVGLEDVTVPAGTFPNCLKMVRKIYSGQNSSSNSVNVYFYYYAKGVGLVKHSYPGFITELSIAKIGNNVYPTGATFVQGEGDWSDPGSGKNDRFYLAYNPGNNPIYTLITLINFLDEAQSLQYTLKSTDGINFVPDPGYYDGVNGPPPPNLSLTIENNTIVGTLDAVTITGTY